MVSFIILGKHKRDQFSEPIRNVNDWKIKALKCVASFLDIWKLKGNSKSSLTHETFTACIQTLRGLAELSEYLLKKKNFKFILLGKINSDPLEGRFGWYRQLCGANFYISVKQLMDSEKKIRVLSLLSAKLLSTATLSAAITERDESVKVVSLINMHQVLVADIEENMSSEDRNMCFYVGGYLGRSISRERKCEGCKYLLVARNDVVTEVDNIMECNRELLDDVNRGGLSEPTTYCFTLTCLAYLYFQQVQHNISAKEELLKSPNQRDLFVKSMLAVAGEELPNTILCDKKHDVQNVLFKKVFNCFSKNF